MKPILVKTDRYWATYFNGKVSIGNFINKKDTLLRGSWNHSAGFVETNLPHGVPSEELGKLCDLIYAKITNNI